MAMQSGSVMVPEKVPAVQWHSHPPRSPYHQMDEREAFLMWLRGEFAAANAMIDALCHHLRAVGDHGEYDTVIASVQQRRCNWNPVLHMQQYFSVADVVYALQNVVWSRQQQQWAESNSARTGNGGKEFRRGGRGYNRGGDLVEGQNNGGGVLNGKDQHPNSNAINTTEKSDAFEKEKFDKKEEKKIESDEEEREASCLAKRQEPQQEAASEEGDDDDGDAGTMNGDASGFASTENPPKTFVASEIHDGKSVNIAEGLKLYEDLCDDSEISKLITLVKDLRASGRKGELQGQAFVVSKRPMKGHGRVMIQLGTPPTAADEENLSDIKTEPLPESLQDVTERLLAKEIISIKPDSCIVDIFDEGDHSQPHSWPHWLGRPVCVLFLTDCEMVFGKSLTVADHPGGDYRGALKLSLHPGDLLLVEGKSADFAKHAIPSVRKQRILVTLTKSLPKKVNNSWSPPPSSRSPSHHHQHARRPPSSRVLLAAPNGPRPPPNGIFVPGIGFPTAAAALTRLPLSGTGVFLPPQNSGGGSSSPPPNPNVKADDDGGSEKEVS